MILNRLIQFRKTISPDPPNPLGFTKKAQTYDHILTMQTIASKYKKITNLFMLFLLTSKKRLILCVGKLYFYKLAKIGITGKFYNVLRNMYAYSYAYIKLSGHLSNKFNILKGTEQGHPLSPDLFKIFLGDLSPLLEFSDCPYLSNLRISHLLWADELIMLSLNKNTAQRQINKLSNFCKEWGIEINELKTKVVIFGEKYDAVSSNLNNSFILNH